MLQVSTHGDFQDHIRLWKYPGLMQLASRTAHSARVLYMAVSPDGESVVTGAADETLHFWNMFLETSFSEGECSVYSQGKNIFNQSHFLQ
jgi:WD40 repeat protein